MTSRRASDIAGDKIKERRLQQELTAQDLAERCAELGAPEISAAVIANIETGRRDKQTGKRRRDITIDELVILAQALKTSPTDLVLPPAGNSLAIAAEVEAPPMSVAEWFAGRDWPGFGEPVPYARNTAHLRLYHAAWEAWEAFKTYDRAARWAHKSGDEAAAGQHAAAADDRLRDFGQAIDAMIDAGLESPWVMPGIAQRMVALECVKHGDELRIIDVSDLDEAER